MAKLGDSNIWENPDENQSFQRVADDRDSESGRLQSACTCVVLLARDQQHDVLQVAFEVRRNGRVDASPHEGHAGGDLQPAGYPLPLPRALSAVRRIGLTENRRFDQAWY